MTQFVVSRQLKLQELIYSLANHEDGQDMIEYALLAALISIVAIAVIILVGPALRGMFQDVVNGFPRT
ncbi:MAG: Flp family type IVb pilin [Chloroflexota bacterium]